MLTIQEKFWANEFGSKYTKRNPHTPLELNRLYRTNFGITRQTMNREFLPKQLDKILEVGCNVGAQLALLQKQGYKDLYGIEINPQVVKQARRALPKTNILVGSAFELPFRDNYFDMVFTSGVLIHISPRDLKRAMKEIYRVSKKYIWGFEYFSLKPQTILYRGHKDRLWKKNFAQIYLDLFPGLTLVKEKRYKYITDNYTDSMFLLKNQR